MKYIPVDQAQVAITYVESVPKCDQAGVQKRNTEGVPVWNLRVMVRVIGDPGRPEIVDLGVPSNRDLGEVLEPLQSLTCTDLRAFPWSMEGRSGVAFSASSVRQDKTSKVVANGHKPVEVPA